MSKTLRDITPKSVDVTPDNVKKALKGREASWKTGTDSELSIGTDPGVDYCPKPKAEQDFVKSHKVKTITKSPHAEEGQFSAKDLKYALKTKENSRMGRDEKESKSVYEESEKKKKKVKISAPGNPGETYQTVSSDTGGVI